MPKSFHQAGSVHCSCQFLKFRKFREEGSVVFVSELRQSRQFLAWPLARCCSSLSTRRTVGWLDVGVGGEPSHRLRRVLRWQNLLLRPPERCSKDHRNPTPPKPPGASVWPSYPQSALRDTRHGLRCAERAPCRRRAREAVPSNSRAPGQIRPS